MDKYEKKAIEQAANLMCAAARTAPKACGIDNIETKIIGRPQIKRLAEEMKKTAKSENLSFFARDAENISKCDRIVLIGTRIKPIGLKYCGFCGFKDCATTQKKGAVCSYNPLDLGIALGSAVNIASSFHIDNRVMYTIGKTALKIGLFGKNIKIALGIPLSASGKNIFFDRK
ncbi:MAG: ferredoxin [Candidatus Omnitrophica bacterium CG11_big_fil_rev_8_21_14_0_20_42_13]|uniref:Ferredoxin n=1 Tax=Candidatus Ghiorseimicrobium undicola TaxID=1974746 RepID=A0A2H0LX45_9BACT|nr:MAG: ferredoxin [Candidatus Omnitrophica bacterium CG11_big_fil_rev_8_21_14_0_20_42_13]